MVHNVLLKRNLLHLLLHHVDIIDCNSDCHLFGVIIGAILTTSNITFCDVMSKLKSGDFFLLAMKPIHEDKAWVGDGGKKDAEFWSHKYTIILIILWTKVYLLRFSKVIVEEKSVFLFLLQALLLPLILLLQGLAFFFQVFFPCPIPPLLISLNFWCGNSRRTLPHLIARFCILLTSNLWPNFDHPGLFLLSQKVIGSLSESNIADIIITSIINSLHNFLSLLIIRNHNNWFPLHFFMRN